MLHWILLKARGIINKKETKPLFPQTLQSLQTNLSQAVRWHVLPAKSCTQGEPGGKTAEFGSSSSLKQFQSAQSELVPTLPGWELLPGRVLCPQQGFEGGPWAKPACWKTTLCSWCWVYGRCLINSLQFPKTTNHKKCNIFLSLQMWEV